MLDCIEIDGASNNGVENVRDLIEKARFEPNQWKYKIYIIDEVHMLSTGAFNALLKTLEEPPKHVKFILATTEIDKVPETIRSRSLRFDFKKISETDIVKRLEYVCGEEGIKADKEALEIIARAARGALRDALTLTEQNTVNQAISTEYVRSTLSLIEDSLIAEIISTIVVYDRAKMIEILDTLRSRHAEVRGLFDQILYGLRDAMMTSFEGKDTTTNFAEYSDIFAIFESAYTRIKSIPDGWLLIEITLMRAVARDEKKEENLKISQSWQDNKKSQTPEIKQTLSENTKATEKKIESIEENKSEKKDTKDILPKDDGEKETKKTVEKTDTVNSSFSYIEFLEAVKQSKPTLVIDLKTARFEIRDTTLTLIFSKEWHYGRINTSSSKNALAEVLQQLYEINYNILCKLDTTPGANIADDVF